MLLHDGEGLVEDLRQGIGDRFEIEQARDASEARRILIDKHLRAVLLSLDACETPGGSDFRQLLRDQYPEIPVVLVATSPAPGALAAAMRSGAAGCIVGDCDSEELQVQLDLAVERRGACLRVGALKESGAGEELVGASPFMRRLRQDIDRYARSGGSVLITGESGCGEELVARSLHALGERRNEPFVMVRGSASPETLLESVLFGHEEGVFTGAQRRRVGRLQEAGHGTLFLDEVTALNLDGQAKLLGAVTEGRFRPLGSSREVPCTARLIVGSQRDLVAEVRARRLRQDLFFHLQSQRIHLLPLRERVEDIEPLTRHFLRQRALEWQHPVPVLDEDVLLLLQSQTWSGNLRELRNTIENALFHCEGDRLRCADFHSLARENYQSLPYDEAKRCVLFDFKTRYISDKLRATAGNVAAAARLMEIPRQTLHRHMRELGLRRDRFLRRKRASASGAEG